MFEETHSLLKLLFGLVYYTFYYSYKIGEFLVTVLDYTIRCSVLFCKGLLNLVLILAESMSVFLEDIVRELHQFYVTVSTYADFITNIVLTTSKTVHSSISSGFNYINHIVNTVCETYVQGFGLSKWFIIILGDGAWFLITIVPYFLYCAVTQATSLVNEFFVNITEAVKSASRDFYTFVTHIPYESLFSIAVFISLLYVFLQVYKIIFVYLYQQTRNFQRKSYRYVRRLITQLRGYFTNSPSVTVRSNFTPRARPMIHRKEPQEDEINCVICQERSKCILMLPCRHVCVCKECYIELRLYSETCPICRVEIEHTMNVFI